MRKIYWIIVLFCFIMSCGDGGGDTPVPKLNPYMRMKPPVLFTDNTPLDPNRDLKFWKIYAIPADNTNWALDNSTWLAGEVREIAHINVVDNNALVTEFNLNLLSPYLLGGAYDLKIKVEAMDGQHSDFADNSVKWLEIE